MIWSVFFTIRHKQKKTKLVAPLELSQHPQIHQATTVQQNKKQIMKLALHEEQLRFHQVKLRIHQGKLRIHQGIDNNHNHDNCNSYNNHDKTQECDANANDVSGARVTPC